MKWKVNIVERRMKDHGSITRWRGGKAFTIYLNEKDSPLVKIGTLFHEFAHLACWMLFADGVVNEDKEHEFCSAMDNMAISRMGRLLK